MRLELENNTERFTGIRIALTVDDVQHLIEQLQNLKSSPRQHFHLTADGHTTLVDIEIGIQGEDAISNATITGFAIQADGA